MENCQGPLLYGLETLLNYIMTITAWESIIIILEKSFFEYPPTAGGENQPSSWEPTQEGGGDTHTCGLPSGQQEDEEQGGEVAEPRAAGEVLHLLGAGETQGGRRGWPRAQRPQ